MGPILALSLRQLAGRWRLTITILLAALPVVIASIVRLVGADIEEHFAPDILDRMVVTAILPIITMTLATASFGNEMEDKTLSYLVLRPVPRYQLVLPKMLATMIIAGPILAISGIALVLIAGEGGAQMAMAVGIGLLVGVAAYSAIFTWAGLVTSHALPYALVYVFLWEGIVGGFLPAVRYLSVRGHSLAMMYGVDGTGFDRYEDLAIEFPAAIVGAIIVIVGFLWLTIRRLRTMDVP
jgi:ABC-2 type transport system permease protein